ncbi:helix-turn-helix domain-containing protein [Chitinophaga sp. MM2321]|uniref:helix-turn-helix domain-containing protein n=1 Tax=Chitinophaga sp. MM2321 TaxID=3137178 RepID=UPI0032D59C62
MIYRVFHPAPYLYDIVEHYWYASIDLTAAAIQHYPTPLLQGLAFNFKKQSEQHTYNNKTLNLDKQVYLFGQPTSPRVITTNENGVNILGVKFKPLGITKITGINMEWIADQIIPAEDIWGKELELLCDEMQSAWSLEQTILVLEEFLIKKYKSTSLHYRANSVQKAIELIDQSKGAIDIKTLQVQTNTSRKTLERAFLHYLGLMPKLYSGIVRFNAVKQMMDCSPCLSVSDIAYDIGYYDNSHLSANFKRFSGLTPTEYIENIRLARLKNAHFRENGSIF